MADNKEMAGREMTGGSCLAGAVDLTTNPGLGSG